MDDSSETTKCRLLREMEGASPASTRAYRPLVFSKEASSQLGSDSCETLMSLSVVPWSYFGPIMVLASPQAFDRQVFAQIGKLLKNVPLHRRRAVLVLANVGKVVKRPFF